MRKEKNINLASRESLVSVPDANHYGGGLSSDAISMNLVSLCESEQET